MKQLSPLERAIEYIEIHLDEDINLSDVSKETGYSYYHMTRLFSSAMGEPIGRYINKRRLYNASETLIHSDLKVIEIALDSGFESSEAFSRAFKAAFGSSPAEYRKAGLNLVVNAKRELAPEDIFHIANNISHKPELLQMDELKIAGIRGNTSLFDNKLPELWKQFTDLHKKFFGSQGPGYCICESQQTTYSKDGDASFSVMIGSPVDSFDALPQPFCRKVISAGSYAVFTHRGALANLSKTYQYIYGTWLTAAKEKLDAREDFEVYVRRVVSYDAPDNEVHIYIPLKSKTL